MFVYFWKLSNLYNVKVTDQVGVLLSYRGFRIINTRISKWEFHHTNKSLNAVILALKADDV